MRLRYLADTNLLLRWIQPQTIEHPVAVSAVTTVQSRGDLLCIVPQNLIEYWGVATRPAQNNGLGLTVAQAQSEVQRLKQMFLLLPDSSGIYPAWEQIVFAAGVQGKQVHDARLVAAMHVHGVSHILTFNTADFVRYRSVGPGITVVHPRSV